VIKTNACCEGQEEKKEDDEGQLTDKGPNDLTSLLTNKQNDIHMPSMGRERR
jgi:hypothetical protein